MGGKGIREKGIMEMGNEFGMEKMLPIHSIQIHLHSP